MSGIRRFLAKILGGGSGSLKRASTDPKRYRTLRTIGEGTFGLVYEAKDRVNGNIVAIKKMEINEDGHAEHELNMNLQLYHPNLIRLLGHYQETRKNSNPPVSDMRLVLEYFKTSLRTMIDDYRKHHERMPAPMVRVLTFQLFRGLHYLHSKSIMHRDIKPSNLLVNQNTYVLKISDFGSSKRIVPGEPRSSNVCSAPYRAPELELKNEDYNEQIDIWAGGCVMAECCMGQTLFRPVVSVTQYDLIRVLLGDPTDQDIAELQPLLKNRSPSALRCAPTIDERFSQLNPPLQKTAISLIKRILAYRPSQRPSAIELCADPYYDPLRRMHGYEGILYTNFIDEELENVNKEQLERIFPPQFRNEAVKRKLEESQEQPAIGTSEKSQTATMKRASSSSNS